MPLVSGNRTYRPRSSERNSICRDGGELVPRLRFAGGAATARTAGNSCCVRVSIPGFLCGENRKGPAVNGALRDRTSNDVPANRVPKLCPRNAFRAFLAHLA